MTSVFVYITIVRTHSIIITNNLKKELIKKCYLMSYCRDEFHNILADIKFIIFHRGLLENNSLG